LEPELYQYRYTSMISLHYRRFPSKGTGGNRREPGRFGHRGRPLAAPIPRALRARADRCTTHCSHAMPCAPC